jgi:hypothetical protein
MLPGDESVNVRVAASRDNYGNRTAAGEVVRYDGCAVYPYGTSTEASGRSLTTIDGYTVLLPPDAVIDQTYEVEWMKQPGEWRAVVGKAALWDYLDGEGGCLQVNVRGEEG